MCVCVCVRCECAHVLMNHSYHCCKQWFFIWTSYCQSSNQLSDSTTKQQSPTLSAPESDHVNHDVKRLCQDRVTWLQLVLQAPTDLGGSNTSVSNSPEKITVNLIISKKVTIHFVLAPTCRSLSINWLTRFFSIFHSCFLSMNSSVKCCKNKLGDPKPNHYKACEQRCVQPNHRGRKCTGNVPFNNKKNFVRMAKVSKIREAVCTRNQNNITHQTHQKFTTWGCFIIATDISKHSNVMLKPKITSIQKVEQTQCKWPCAFSIFL